MLVHKHIYKVKLRSWQYDIPLDSYIDVASLHFYGTFYFVRHHPLNFKIAVKYQNQRNFSVVSGIWRLVIREQTEVNFFSWNHYLTFRKVKTELHHYVYICEDQINGFFIWIFSYLMNLVWHTIISFTSTCFIVYSVVFFLNQPELYIIFDFKKKNQVIFLWVFFLFENNKI